MKDTEVNAVSVSSPALATINNRNVPGSSCRCGESRLTFSIHHEGWSVPSMELVSSISPGAPASDR